MNKAHGALLAVLAALTFAGSCIYSIQRGTSWQELGFVLPPSAQLMMSTIPDGGGEDGLIVGSGSNMTFKVRQELLKRQFAVTVTSKQQLDELLVEARAASIPYVLFGRITKWEDNATDWSGQRDYAGLLLELYDAGSGKLVATSDRAAEGVQTPESCADWLANVSVRALLGTKVNPAERPSC